MLYRGCIVVLVMTHGFEYRCNVQVYNLTGVSGTGLTYTGIPNYRFRINIGLNSSTLRKWQTLYHNQPKQGPCSNYFGKNESVRTIPTRETNPTLANPEKNVHFLYAIGKAQMQKHSFSLYVMSKCLSSSAQNVVKNNSHKGTKNEGTFIRIKAIYNQIL